MKKRTKRSAKARQKTLEIKPREKGVFGAAIYCRVSTLEQDYDSQLGPLRRYCEQRGWQIQCEACETASGISDRPWRNALLDAARRQEIDAIVVYKLDRWGRSTGDLVCSLNELDEIGVPLVSVTDALDMTTAAGKALCGMLAVFAGFERDLARERIKAGLQAARERGVVLGRKPTALAKTDEILALRATGLSQRKIAEQLGISHGSVGRILALQSG